MPSEIICPACGQRLTIAEEARGAPLSCPRCLAKLPAQPATAPPFARAIRAQRLLDTEVHSDTRRTGAGLIVLAVLGGLGIAYYLFVAIVFGVSAGDVTPVVIFLVVLAFLALLSTGIVLWRTRANPAARGVGRIVFGTLTLAGIVTLGIIILCIALLVFFFAVCLSGKPLF